MDHDMENDHPFYGIEIIPITEQEYIRNLLKKYDNTAVTEDLKGKIWDELQMEKHKGNITIPFKVVMRKDASKHYPDFVEIILDSKV